MSTQSKTTTIWEAEQDMDGGGNPLSSWSAYWIDEAGDAHPLVESADRQTARLIAAAPDMLALLSGFVRDAARLGDTPDSDPDKSRALKAFLHMIYTTGGAAIARATGVQS